MKKPIVLIGMMGSGKTTLGNALAKKLKLNWIDTDQWIENRMGMNIPEIFTQLGEGRFREEERSTLVEALNSYELVSTGGGIVVMDSNRALLRDQAFVIYLKTEPDALLDRIKQSDRPLLKDLPSLYDQRRRWYEQSSDVTIDTTKKSPESCLSEIIDCLNSKMHL